MKNEYESNCVLLFFFFLSFLDFYLFPWLKSAHIADFLEACAWQLLHLTCMNQNVN